MAGLADLTLGELEIVLRGRGTPQVIRVIDDAERLADTVRRIRTAGREAQERRA